MLIKNSNLTSIHNTTTYTTDMTSTDASGTASVQYRKSLNTIHLRCAWIGTATDYSGVLSTTLPIAWRPPNTQYVTVALVSLDVIIGTARFAIGVDGKISWVRSVLANAEVYWSLSYTLTNNE